MIASLLQHFDFWVFLSYGAAVIPFVERRFGFNFTTEGDDAALIDRIAQLDADRIVRGDYPASNMFAVLRHRGMAVHRIFDPVSPQRHVELTRQQLKRCDAIRA